MPTVSREHSSDAAASPRRRSRAREEIQPLLEELKAALGDLYGERLARVVLYGSFARGEATDASDVDVLVVLRGAVDERTEIKRTSEMLYALQTEHRELIALLPISWGEYHARAHPLMVNVRREGQLV